MYSQKQREAQSNLRQEVGLVPHRWGIHLHPRRRCKKDGRGWLGLSWRWEGVQVAELSVRTTLPRMLCSVVPGQNQDSLSMFDVTARYLHPWRGGEHVKDFVLILDTARISEMWTAYFEQPLTHSSSSGKCTYYPLPSALVPWCWTWGFNSPLYSSVFTEMYSNRKVLTLNFQFSWFLFWLRKGTPPSCSSVTQRF